MTTQDGAALSVRNLGKRFGDRVAFEDVSFGIGHGEVFGFLGPNGAGKTTTVRTLGTLIAPTSGSATAGWCCWRSQARLAAYRRDVRPGTSHHRHPLTETVTVQIPAPRPGAA